MREAMATGLTVTVNNATWIIPAINLPKSEPKPGDLIVSNQNPTGVQEGWIVAPQGVSGLIEAEWKLVCTRTR
jgi:hypothetical protein